MERPRISGAQFTIKIHMMDMTFQSCRLFLTEKPFEEEYLIRLDVVAG